MERYQEIEKSIMTDYLKAVWDKFIKAVRDYELIKNGDKIAVCISGGKDSMLMAKCFQELQKHNEYDFELVFLVMNPGYDETSKNKIIENSKLLNIPITMFETKVFDVVNNIDDNPCYICSSIRRKHLYNKANELGCNKIALGHHFDDVIETILMGMLFGSQIQTMMPKLKSPFHPGMELIRPMYLVKEEDIISWRDVNNLEFLKCSCNIVKENGDKTSKRTDVKRIIADLKKEYGNIDINIFRSVENVNLNSIISYKKDEERHHFLDDY